MFDSSKYRDIEPYKGVDFKESFARFLSKTDMLSAFVGNLLLDDDPRKDLFTSFIYSTKDRIQNYSDFQNVITAGVLIPAIVEKTVKEFSFSGTENLDNDKGYLFISTHRDIVLDCALTDYALMLSKKPLCQMAFGDNLISSQFVEDLFRLNGGVIVKRDLPMREKYLESIRLSEYLVDTVTLDNCSIWIAQKSGRSKDGLDITHPAIIKMLFLSKKKDGISFADLIKSVRIVPVSISYEYNPNDINMAREEVAIRKNGAHEKKKYEDTISMMRGIKGYKGRVHVSFGQALEGDYENPEEVAKEIDRQIHLSYRLFSTNYIAYDILSGKNEFKSNYSDFDRASFINRLSHLTEEVKMEVIRGYANPVKSYLEQCGKL
ncbi:MAG TPA: 1-acyl-sn-glycerol-3-phosphate acyltransferase [Candidatus Ornithospirochaeta avicola]|uniref:1-acyl-sn-glycerol-3-phosphate acyltransferase n=1 Tax=Candidatus Ornithospirochaeta avicola TaxID=2840896 RepID=A0A9D1PU46_9SPIO|nr:1-acyl-sn-glycerol-3-phosphate acyltransferase [Candidatus Ornithospirochaeta avicola]